MAIAVVAALAASACGSATGPGREVAAPTTADPHADPGGWAFHRLGPAVDVRGTVGTTSGDGVAVLSARGEGDGRRSVRAHLVGAERGADVVPVEEEGAPYRTIRAVVDGPAGLVAVGVDADPEANPLALRSVDGTGWEEVATSGLDEPMEVSGLAATPEGYVVVGASRTGGSTAAGGASPVVLTSPDGTTWASAQLPSSGSGALYGVAAAGEVLVAVGQVDEASVAWRSSDGGLTWRDDPSVPDADQIAGDGDVVVVARSHSVGQAGLIVHRSVDGATWEPVDAAFTEALSLPRLSAVGSGFALVANRAIADPYTSPEACYADIERCLPSSDDDIVLVSADGASWDRLDLSGLDQLGQVSSVVRSESGDAVVLGLTTDEGWAAWVWDGADGPVPTSATSRDEEEGPAYEGTVVEGGATLVEGERHAFPLHLHCGPRLLGRFNGTPWGLVAGADGILWPRDIEERGKAWPVVGEDLLGFVTLVAEERIEYSLADGEVVGTYVAIPESAVPTCE